MNTYAFSLKKMKHGLSAGLGAVVLTVALSGNALAEDEVSQGRAFLEKQEFTQAAAAFAKGFDAGNGEAGFYLARMVELGVGFPADTNKARILYLASAEKGSASALNRLGLMHLRGENVRQDYVAAAELICKSADLGNQEGQFNCAGLELDGTGLKQDPTAALNNYKKAALSGHVGAKNMLAVMTRQGTGTPANAEHAFKLFEEIGAYGNPVALFNLGEMLESGEGTAADPVKAHLYFNLANERGHPSAGAALETITAEMSKEQIEEAQTLARDWKPASNESNSQ